MLPPRLLAVGCRNTGQRRRCTNCLANRPPFNIPDRQFFSAESAHQRIYKQPNFCRHRRCTTSTSICRLVNSSSLTILDRQFFSAASAHQQMYKRQTIRRRRRCTTCVTCLANCQTSFNILVAQDHVELFAASSSPAVHRRIYSHDLW